MHNMIRFQWMPLSLRRRVLLLAFVAGVAFCLMATSATCFAQQIDGSTGTKSIAETAPVVSPIPSVSCQNGQGKEWVPSKVQEILLQFLFAGVLGGLFTFLLSALRDSKLREEGNLTALRDLVMQVDELYRSTKQTKRMIRSRLKQGPDGYEIDGGFFAARMEELSNAQLKLEQLRNSVRTRSDLFDVDRTKRILKEVEYSEKYLHDVVQEFERRGVSWSDDSCRISSSCEMLMDFLGETWMPPEVEGDFRTMRDDARTVKRFRAFQSITSNCGRQRHKSISDGCMLLVMREMRDMILERQPRLSLDRLVRRPKERDESLEGLIPVSSPDRETSSSIGASRSGLEEVR